MEMNRPTQPEMIPRTKLFPLIPEIMVRPNRQIRKYSVEPKVLEILYIGRRICGENEGGRVNINNRYKIFKFVIKLGSERSNCKTSLSTEDEFVAVCRLVQILGKSYRTACT